ncbi:E3 ubiquitin-protein ligase RNF220 isoform X2 [Microcaecilia unicolor]|uniref:E3 ubiquitin-protein ligase RNF220-like isoform X2 n=1 Tax=Microcaecilia unicolor TaxID=1415580 RepID=A0A6P7XLB6_9AMPH|nr:E3 ubiquitin-protein ligase RNF220-like isoform X2 [Microcaecilia unicolor]
MLFFGLDSRCEREALAWEEKPSSMENPSSLIGSLSSPALLILASTSEATRGSSATCQQPCHFGVPLTLEKATQLPFLTTAYSLLYHHPERLTSPAPSRDYPSQLLPVHTQFAAPNLDRAGVGMLGYGGTLRPFPPFHLSEDVECFPAGLLASRRGETQGTSEPPQVRYLTLEKDLEAPGTANTRESGLNPGTAPFRNSPVSRHIPSRRGDKTVGSCSPLYCPLCEQELQHGHLKEHLQYEFDILVQLSDSLQEAPQEDEDLSEQSAGMEREGTESPSSCPQASEDRQQTFLQVKCNREARLGARAGRCKRIKSNLDERLVVPLFRDPKLEETEDELSAGERWGEINYQGQKKSFLEMKDCRPSSPRSPWSQENDVDVDSEAEDLPAFAKQKHTTSDPRNSLGDIDDGSGNLMDKCENRSAVTMETLKLQIQELTERLLRSDLYKCHICLDSYTVPLTSIQCWHIHCEQCWLRTLGSKKLCPQCSTITSPADLRRVYF